MRLEDLKGRPILAPMAGVTDRVFRSICRNYACPFAVTEMVSAKGFLLSPQNTYRQGLLDREEGEPLALQLFGHEPQVVAEAARRIGEESFSHIDINMGCPAPKIVGNGEGSALMRTPHLAEAIVRETVRASRLPVTVKMRLGWEERCHVDFALRMQDAGASAVTVHGRLRSQFYSGSADWDAIAEVVRALSIPVIGNGDIDSAQSFLHMLDHTGCFAGMIGRGAMGNPFIFEEIDCAIRGVSYVKPSMEQKVETALLHARLHCETTQESIAIPQMRKHIAWYIAGVPGGAALRRRVHAANTLEEIEGILQDTEIT